MSIVIHHLNTLQGLNGIQIVLYDLLNYIGIFLWGPIPAKP